MVKKTLLSMAIAAAVVSIAGCNVSTTDRHDGKIHNDAVKVTQSSSVYPLFNPSPVDGSDPQLPLATDIIFAINSQADGTPGKDGTASTVDTGNPVTLAVNKLAGFSTVAPLYINFSKELDPASVVAGQTVFLVKLATKKQPLEAADNPDPKPVSPDVYEASPITLVGDNGQDVHSLRILFKKPLDPKSKYMVILTDGIKGTNGEAAGSSATYEILESKDFINNASDQVLSLRKTIQDWQKLAGMVLGGKANSVFSYTFTTDGSLDALKYYAAPALFLEDTPELIQEKAEALTDTVNGSSVGTYLVARTAVIRRVKQDPNYNPTLGELQDVNDEAIEQMRANPNYVKNLYALIASANLQGLLQAANPVTFSGAAKAPEPREVDLIPVSNVDAAIGSTASPSTFIAQGDAGNPFHGDTFTRYIQGQIKLPNFLSKAAPHADIDTSWKASETVGRIIDAALGQELGTTPPKDVLVDQDDNKTLLTNVTYHYPFAEVDATQPVNTAPSLVTMPGRDQYSAESDCADTKYDNGFPVVIYVHGITGSRANMLAYSAALASNCIASVAIDLPMHGVAPKTNDANGASQANPLTLFNAKPGDAASTGSP